MNREQRYLLKRRMAGSIQSILFYLFRVFPIKKKKIVLCSIEGTTGYSCNPKYIAEELIRRKADCELVWLVDDLSKKFPKQIKVVRNTLWNRAYQLTTAKIWIDNSRKQLEARKRKGQIYIQTWHAKLGFKPTCLDRGASFSRIAYLVSRHDSSMIDYVLSNSQWYERTLPTGMMYDGAVLRFGSPRCDILINETKKMRAKVRQVYRLPENAKILMYAPTFRGGSQETGRKITADAGTIDYGRMIRAFEKRFGGKWYVMLRLHPQLAARNIKNDVQMPGLINISRADDMYDILAGCDAFVTDYSSAAFDAAVMRIPVFLYCDDYRRYQNERGSLLWDLEQLPFPLAQDNGQLQSHVEQFDQEGYLEKLEQLFEDTQMVEDGKASERMADFIKDLLARTNKQEKDAGAFRREK